MILSRRRRRHAQSIGLVGVRLFVFFELVPQGGSSTLRFRKKWNKVEQKKKFTNINPCYH